MAISATVVWEVQTGGNDLNGGGFDSAIAGGTDRSQSTSPFVTFDGATISGSTSGAVAVLAVTGYTTATADAGNILNITGGTNFIVGRYRILSAVAGVSWTLDRTCTTGVGAAMTGRMGGCLASPGQAAAVTVAGNVKYIKAGTYSITSATPNVAGGIVNDASGGTTAQSVWIGYQTTRGDGGTPPLLQASGISSCTLFLISNWGYAENIKVDGALLTSIMGMSVAQYGVLWLCRAVNCTNSGATCASGASMILCEVSGCTTQPAVQQNGYAFACEVHDNAAIGFNIAGLCVQCLSYRNTTGFINSNVQIVCFACTAAFNSAAGFDAANNQWEIAFANCVSYGNGGWGFKSSAPMNGGVLASCAGGSNTSGNFDAANWLRVRGFIALTANPFVNAVITANGAANFALNSTAGGGAALVAGGILGPTPSGNAIGYTDIGAMQLQAGAAGMLYIPGLEGA